MHRRLLLLPLCLGLVGCTRYVVKVDTDPTGGAVTLGGNKARGNRWSVPTDSVAHLAATWPDGKRVDTAFMVDRDIQVLLRRDGDPAKLLGATPVGATPAPPPVAAVPVPIKPPPEPVPTIPIADGSTPPSGDPMTRAKELADAGQKAYELTEYDEAIAKFKQAYELIRSSKDPKAPEILGNLLYNMAVVNEQSYELKRDPERLRRARIMYKQFDEQMATLVPNWSTTAEHAEVLRRIRALDARLEGKDATPK